MSEGDGITWTSSQGVAVIHLAGEFDLVDVDHLRDCCHAAVAAFGSRVVLDLSETTFLDSSALGVLIGVARELHEQQGWLRFASVQNGAVARLFDITGVDRVLGLYDTVQEAAVHD